MSNIHDLILLFSKEAKATVRPTDIMELCSVVPSMTSDDAVLYYNAEDSEAVTRMVPRLEGVTVGREEPETMVIGHDGSEEGKKSIAFVLSAPERCLQDLLIAIEARQNAPALRLEQEDGSERAIVNLTSLSEVEKKAFMNAVAAGLPIAHRQHSLEGQGNFLQIRNKEGPGGGELGRLEAFLKTGKSLYPDLHDPASYAGTIGATLETFSKGGGLAKSGFRPAKGRQGRNRGVRGPGRRND